MRAIKIQQSITNRKEDSVGLYFNDVEKILPVTPEEECELAKKIRAGDKAALDRLVSANLRFVISIAKKYAGGALTLNDLISEGNAGLIEAAKRFDETRGFKFISYAVWWIRQAMLLANGNHERMIRLPMNQVIAITKINQSKSKLTQKLERDPTMEELAKDTGLTLSKIVENISVTPPILSLDKTINEDTNSILLDLIADKDSGNSADQMERHDLSCELRTFMSKKLTRREQFILEKIFGIGTGIPLSMEEVAYLLDLSKERVRQLKDQALKKLRQFPTAKTLFQYLP